MLRSLVDAGHKLQFLQLYSVTGHATSGGDKRHVSLDSYKTASVGKKNSAKLVYVDLK